MSAILAVCGDTFCAMVSDGRYVEEPITGEKPHILKNDLPKVRKINRNVVVGFAHRYLTKPVEKEKLYRALNELDKDAYSFRRLLVRNGGDSKLIDIDSIYFIKVERKDAYIHYDSGGEEKVFVCKRSLDSLEKELTPFHFFRTHRSYLTNLSMIDYLNTDGIYIKNREESIPIRAKSLNKISRKLRELARQRNAL